VINGTYHHDVKSISNYHNYRKRIRLTNNDIIEEFITYLSNENWNSVLNSYDGDSKSSQ
jgi:hypothetical protein